MYVVAATGLDVGHRLYWQLGNLDPLCGTSEMAVRGKLE